MLKPLSLVSLAILLLLCALPLAAQPTAVVNVASFANPNLPNGKVAQGSMFTVFGTNIGPATLAQQSGFRLPTELGGTSVQVSSGGQNFDCIMIFAVATQVAAILPSATPVGAGTLTVIFNGQRSAPIPITVVAHSFGTFGINQQGSGPGVLTNAINPLSVNTILNSALPGEMWDIWGTGLGPVQGDEADRPLPGELGFDTQVLVGAASAQVLYRGRSGCCAGIDQIRFVVPTGITGCYVPITVVIEGVASNFTTMAISETAGPCSDPATGLSADALSRAQTNGALRIGNINASRGRFSFDIPDGVVGQSFSSITDSISASFESLTLAQVQSYGGLLTVNTVGACTVYQYRNSTGDEFEDPVNGTPLDAGNLSLSGPEGAPRAIPKATDGSYFELLSSPFGFLASVLSGKLGGLIKGQIPGGSGYFQTGEHTVTGAGGTQVGAFTTTFNVGPPLNWTNPTTTISRSAAFTVRWEGGTGEHVVIFGSSAYDFEEEDGSGAAFWCLANRAAGSFTIPEAVLASLPATVTTDGIPAGLFAVGSQEMHSTTIPNIDSAITIFSDLSLHSGVAYQ